MKRRVGVFMEREYGEISDVYVREPERRRGIGTALVQEALRWFEARRIGRVHLQTDTRNQLGVEFWTHLGFRTTAYSMDRLL